MEARWLTPQASGCEGKEEGVKQHSVRLWSDEFGWWRAVCGVVKVRTCNLAYYKVALAGNYDAPYKKPF